MKPEMTDVRPRSTKYRAGGKNGQKEEKREVLSSEMGYYAPGGKIPPIGGIGEFSSVS